MKKGSVLLKLPVVNVDVNEKIGIVTGFVFDPDRMAVAALIIEPSAAMEGLRAIPFESIVSLYETAVMIEGTKEPVNVSEHKELLNIFLKDINLSGSMVISDDGKTMGIARDFTIDPDGAIQSVFVRLKSGAGECEIAKDNIVRLTAQEIIVRAESGRMLKTAGQSVHAAAAVEFPGQSQASEISTSAALENSAGFDFAAARGGAREVPEYRGTVSNGAVEEIKKEIRRELFALFETFFSDRLKGHFLEMVQIILERINQEKTKDELARIREETRTELQSIRSTFLPEGDEGIGGSIPLLVEEKVRQVAGSRLDALMERLEKLEDDIGAIRGINTEASEQLKSALDGQTEVMSGLRELFEKRKPDAGAIDGEIAKLPPLTDKTEGLMEKISEIGDELITVRELQDTLRQTWMEISADLSNRFDGLESRMAAPAAEKGTDVAALNELRQSIAASTRGMITKDELFSLLSKMDTTATRLKNLEEESASAVERIIDKVDDATRGLAVEINASVARTTSPMLDNMKKTLERRIEDMKTRSDSFKDEIKELGETLRTNSMKIEKRFDERLAAETSRLSEEISGLTSHMPDAEEFSSSVKTALAALTDAVDNIGAKILEQAAPLKQDIEGHNKRMADAFQEQADGLVYRVREMTETVEAKIAEAASASAAKLEEVSASMNVDDKLADIKAAIAPLVSAGFENMEAMLEKIVTEKDIASLAGLITDSAAKVEKLSAEAASKESVAELQDVILSKIIETITVIDGKQEAAVEDGLAALKEQFADSLSAIASGARAHIEEAAGKEDLAALREELSARIAEETASITGKVETSTTDTLENLKEEVVALLAPGVESLRGTLETIQAKLDVGLGRLTEESLSKGELISFKEEILGEMVRQNETLGLRLSETAEKLATGESMETIAKSLSRTIEEAREKFSELAGEISSSGKLDSLTAINEKLQRMEPALAEMVSKGVSIENIEQIKGELLGEILINAEGTLKAINTLSETKGKFPTPEEIASAVRVALPTPDLEAAVAPLKNEMERLKSDLGELLKESIGSQMEKLAEKLGETAKENTAAAIDSSLAKLSDEIAKAREFISEKLQAPAGEGAAELFEKFEGEFSRFRDSLASRISELAGADETAREDERKLMLSDLDTLLKKTVEGKLEGFIARMFDENIGRIAERLEGKTDAAARGLFSRPKPKEKPTDKKAASKHDTSTEKRLEYLLGRKVGKDVLDEDGNRLVEKGTVVDEKLLAEMKEQRRLLDLIQCIDYTQ